MIRSEARDAYDDLDLNERRAAELLDISRGRLRKALDADRTPKWFEYALMGLEEDLQTGAARRSSEQSFSGRFEGDRWAAITARQAVPILVDCARRGETITYGDLDARLQSAHPERGETGIFTKYGHPLGRISFACEDIRRTSIQNGDPEGYETLPPLTAIVVRGDTGMPGDGFPDLVRSFLEDLNEGTRRNLDWQINFVMEKVFAQTRWDALIEAAQQAAEN